MDKKKNENKGNVSKSKKKTERNKTDVDDAKSSADGKKYESSEATSCHKIDNDDAQSSASGKKQKPRKAKSSYRTDADDVKSSADCEKYEPSGATSFYKTDAEDGECSADGKTCEPKGAKSLCKQTLEEELDPTSITKINIKSLEGFEVKKIKDVDDLGEAERIIQHIINGSKREVKNLTIKQGFISCLEGRQNAFKLHLSVVENRANTIFTEVFSKMVTNESQMLLSGEEIDRSYMLFLYRNLGEKSRDITPEIYAVTTASAWRIVEKFADQEFVLKVEERFLNKNPHHVGIKAEHSTIRVTVDREREIHVEVPQNSIFTRTKKIRAKTSLNSLNEKPFVAESGEFIETDVKVYRSMFRIESKLSIPQLAELLQHFSYKFLNEE